MSDSGANLGESLLEICDRICETARKGERNRKALAGSNFYGDQFHTRLVELSKIERSFLAAIDAGPIAESEVASAKAALSTIKSTSPQGGRRATALKNLRLFIHGSAIHALSNGDSAPAPASEPVLPKAVVIPANKSYLVTVVIQANASYEARCYDACAVMIRKLVEILIIELYEADKKEAEIKDGNGGLPHVVRSDI